MPIDTYFDPAIPKRSVSTIESSGVAMENVVAVPAMRAITARRSMTFPQGPSMCLPSKGLQASEYFCLWQPLTWSMNPNAAASTA